MKPIDETSAADTPLSDFLCFAVYSTNLAFGKLYRPVLDKLGLTYTQYVTLVALSERTARPSAASAKSSSWSRTR